ncbi:MAG: hypothetical protein AB1938_24755 [Myxococcota bacterium]
MRLLFLLACAFALPALAEERDAGVTEPPASGTPAAAAPDASTPAPDAGSGPTSSGAEAAPTDGGTLAAEVAPGDAGTPAAVTAPAATPAPAPAEVGISAAVHGSTRLVGTLVSSFPLDADGTTVAPAPLETRIRITPELSWRRFRLLAEVDVVTGAVAGTPTQPLVASRVPVPPFAPAELRQLFAEYRWGWGGARLGLQTNHFGLGMLANAGAKDSEAGDFGHQHFGSLALRALVLARPFLDLGGAWMAVEPVAAFDLVVRDSTVSLMDGDRALQGILGVRLNVDEHDQVALYAVYRSSRHVATDTGEASTDVFVVDASAQWRFFERLDLGAEVAGIAGTTTQTRSPEHPVVQVRQLGAVAKAAYRLGRFAFLLDAGVASGDGDPYDDQLTSFRFDRDYKVGLILFDHVLGWQSARSAARASDPTLVGYPPESVALLPTGGAVTGAWYLFPRVRVRLGRFVDVYGGPLLAFSTAPLTDPFNTRVLAGGVPVNALNGPGGGALGTELDLGVSVKHRFGFGLTLSAIAEGGLFLPGPAFTQGDGSVMGHVWLGRLRLQAAY